MAAMSGGGGADCFARCLKCIPKPEPAPSVAMRGGMLGSRRESKPLPLRLDRVKSTVEPDRGPDAPVLDSPTREHHQEIIDHATGKTRSSGPKPGLLKAIVFLSRLKEGPNLHLSQYMSDPKVRQKLWRDLEKSTTQKKLTRRGGFLGLGVGYEQVREVRLHTENLSYRHVVKPGEDEKEKFINFDDIRWVGACKGSSKRWKIKMKNEPEYEFICDTHDHRNAWVWCVRNNVNLHHRREMLDEVLAGPHIDNLAPNVADPSDVRPMSTLDNIVESDASDNEW